MTDKELLEAAARAAGIEIDHWRGDIPMVNEDEYDANEYHAWNPLTDDGDCARVEAVIETEIQWHEDGVQAGKRSSQISAFCFYADHGGDKNATRRAASVAFAAKD